MATVCLCLLAEPLARHHGPLPLVLVKSEFDWASYSTPLWMDSVCLCLLTEPLTLCAFIGFCLLSWSKVYLTEPLTPPPVDWLYVPLPLVPSEKVEWIAFYFIMVRRKAQAHRQTAKHMDIAIIRLNTSKGQFSEKDLVPPSLIVTYQKKFWWHICLLIKGGIKISGNLDITHLMIFSWHLADILLT